MKVLILAPGSRGDTAPAAGLGAALVEDGHEVTVVANAEYETLIGDAGCGIAPVHASFTPAPPEGGDGRAPGVRAHLAALRTYMQVAAEATLDASGGTQVVLTNAISPYGHDLAEHLGVPSAQALLQPAQPSRAYPPMIVSGRDLGAPGNLLAGRLAQQVATPYDPACAWVRTQLGMRPESRRAAQRRRLADGVPVHHGISSAVLPRPCDWPDHLGLDGFWWPPARTQWAPPEELSDFLAAGAAPVVVSLGSIPTTDRSIAAIGEALAGLDVRVVLQGEQFRRVAEELGPHRALHVGDVPHEWLLPQAGAVVHHAGAGVAAAALRAGVPSVPLPMHTDQPFWARRVCALSAGTTPLPLKGLTAGHLQTRIGEARTSSRLHEGAQRIAGQLATEDGTRPIRDWLRSLSGQPPTTGPPPTGRDT